MQDENPPNDDGNNAPDDNAHVADNKAAPSDNGDERSAADLGKRLRAARLQKNLTLDAAAEELKIREHYLRAFEKAEYENLPEANYAIGFMRTYSGYLDLPQDETVQQFRQAFGQRKQNTQITGLQEVPKSHASLHYIFLLAVVLCVTLYIVWLGYSQPSHSEISQPQPQPPSAISPLPTTETHT